MKVVGWTSKTIEAVVKAAGWKYSHAVGGHRYYRHAMYTHHVMIPWHTQQHLKPKTAAQILKDARLR